MPKINWLLICILLCSVSSIWAQNVSFSGAVSEKNSNEPLVGANVYFNGTTLGTVTDKNSEFCIKNLKIDGAYMVITSCKKYHCLKKQVTHSGEEITSNLNFSKE